MSGRRRTQRASDAHNERGASLGRGGGERHRGTAEEGAGGGAALDADVGGGNQGR